VDSSTHARYEQRMQTDLDEIRDRVRAVSRLIESQVGDSVHALLEDDHDLANDVILGDRRVNRKIRDIDRLAHAFIVRHAPSAGHLRYVSAVLRLDVALERIGDYASTIGREVIQLSGAPPERVARDVELISHQSRRTLQQSLAAFNEADPELARETYGMAGQTDSTLDKVFDELLEVGESRALPLRDVFGLLRIINLLKRVAEQAENICEQVLFAVSGETKDPKIFRILFLDEGNDLASQMAEAYAQKAFPESGSYASAGWAPVKALDEKLVDFLDRSGVDVRGKSPTMLRPIHEEPRHWHIVVGLSPEARKHIPVLPFRTIFLDWSSVLDGIDTSGPMSAETMQDLWKRVQLRVSDLMLTLRGPNAG
jgi:phosphate transport system protein